LQAITQKQHLVSCHHWEETLATEFDEELGEVYHTIKHTPEDDLAIELSDVEISYHRPGLIDRLRSTPSPPATISDVTLKVRRGETLALVGESGSGKTTIVRTISGLLPAKGGQIQFEDFDLTLGVDDRPKHLRKQIQMIFQNPDASLNPRHSVAEILDQPLKLYFPKMSRDERRARQVELLKRVRLNEQYRLRYPAQLSGGEKQRPLG
jgi:peptide/nickel transport system ATP-binding protein